MSMILYELTPTRSARVRWTLLELGLPFESVEGQELFHSPVVEAIHPLGKLPAFRDNGRPLFESAAIVTWLADSHPEKGLISPSGTWSRALHDQWTAFTLSEIEAFLWHSARNLFVLDEPERLPEVLPQNAAAARQGLAVLEKALEGRAWLVDDRFSVTDIFVGYAVAWAEAMDLATDMPNVTAYARRVTARPLCPYAAMKAPVSAG